MQASPASIAWLRNTSTGLREMERVSIQPRPSVDVSQSVDSARAQAVTSGSPEQALLNWVRTEVSRSKDSIRKGMILLVSRHTCVSLRLCLHLHAERFLIAMLHEQRPEVDQFHLQRGCIRARARSCCSVQRDVTRLVREEFLSPLAHPRLPHQHPH